MFWKLNSDEATIIQKVWRGNLARRNVKQRTLSTESAKDLLVELIKGHGHVDLSELYKLVKCHTCDMGTLLSECTYTNAFNQIMYLDNIMKFDGRGHILPATRRATMNSSGPPKMHYIIDFFNVGRDVFGRASSHELMLCFNAEAIHSLLVENKGHVEFTVIIANVGGHEKLPEMFLKIVERQGWTDHVKVDVSTGIREADDCRALKVLHDCIEQGADRYSLKLLTNDLKMWENFGQMRGSEFTHQRSRRRRVHVHHHRNSLSC